MAVVKKKQLHIRSTKEELFNLIKNAAPGVIGSKVFADVAYFGPDQSDFSKMEIIFAEENDT